MAAAPSDRSDRATSSRTLCLGCGGATMVRDAKDVASALEAIGHANVRLIVGEEATQCRMIEEVSAVLQDAPDSSTVILFFSCHATYVDEDLWLLPDHVPPDPPTPRSQKDLGLNVRELRVACLQSKANVCVILDCCYSGVLATDNLGKLSRKWRTGPGRIFLTSSGAYDRTFYMQKCRNSALTSAILRHLRSAATTNHSARHLAGCVKAYFAERSAWGPTVSAEERGVDFSLSCFSAEGGNEGIAG